jgi:glycolate oxidase FAD binding subunit
MRVVHADGQISKTGGRVVKNVTGYDLAKLYTGSLGSLAVIAEVSLKLRPTFGKTATAIADFERVSEAAAVVKEIRNGPLQPICCELSGLQPSIWVQFGEHPRAVDWQIANLPAANWKTFEGEQETSCWERLRERYRNMGPIVVRVVATPSTIGDVLDSCRPSAWIAHSANGVVLMTVRGADEIRRIREKYPVVIEKAPLEFRRQIPTFGINGTELRLMKELKRALDPEARLNPGRHVDGE